MSRTQRVICGALLLCALATCSMVQAQELELEAPASIHLDVPLELSLSGENGMWFPMATARQILADVTELRLRQEGDAISDAERALWVQRGALSDRALALAVETNNRREALVGALQARTEALEARAGHWSRSRALWLTVGVILGAVGVVAVGYLLAR